MGTFDFAIRSIVAWLVRTRTPESWIFRGAVAVLLALHGSNWVVWIVYRAFTVQLAPESVIPDALLSGITVLCVLLMTGAALWAWKRHVREQVWQSRKKAMVIEGRGLRDDDGSPLVDAIPDSIVGTRSPYLMDLRQRKDGVIVEPEDLLWA